jgi:hypothetical protein
MRLFYSAQFARKVNYLVNLSIHLAISGPIGTLRQQQGY